MRSLLPSQTKLSTFGLLLILFLIFSFNYSILFAQNNPTITVTSLLDTVADDGDCTLREAVVAANMDTASGTTAGECVAGGASETLDMSGLNGVLLLDSALPDIISNITLQGSGADVLTIARNADVSPFRIFTIQNGTASFDNVSIANGEAPVGGGIYNNGGSVSLTLSQLTANTATSSGGAIFNENGTLSITDSVLSMNTATSSGGGIYSAGNTSVTITNTTIGNNTAFSSGGGVYLDGSTLTITGSTISTNVAGSAGAGFYLDNGTATMTNSTLSGNVATTAGGGLYVDGTTLSANHLTIAMNSSGVVIRTGTVTAGNSIIAGNMGNDCIGTLNSNGHNLIQTSTCTIIGEANTDILEQAPGIEPLAPNGGLTQTHALTLDSPALGTANPTTCESLDQRGEIRPQGNGCDIGAFESNLTLGTSNLVGRIIDANAVAADASTIVPLPDATVRHVESGRMVLTDADGFFELRGLPAGENTFDFDGSTIEPVGTFGAYRALYVLQEETTTEIERPIYLMRIDPDSATQVDPNTTTSVNNPNLDITMDIPSRTVVNDDGTFFDGIMTISPVPPEFTPGSLPDTLGPGEVVTIQPMGLTFDNPAPVTFPNIDNLPPGSEVDFWSMDHATSRFFVAGRGRVTDDGTMIETIEGGIRESSWHFVLSPPSNPGTSEDGQNDNNDSQQCEANTGSSATLHNGYFSTDFALPDYVSQGAGRGLEFTYSSERAYPSYTFPFSSTISRLSALPETFSYALSVNGVPQGEEVFLDTSTLSETVDEMFRGAATFEGTSLATDIYPTAVDLTSNFSNSEVSSRLNDRTTVINERNSPFGIGWGLSGLNRLYPTDSDRVLIVDGSGTSLAFNPAPLDLTLWTQEGDPNTGNWILAEDSLSVFQDRNDDPTFFVSPDEYINTSIYGRILPQGDIGDAEGDFIGFVFGYKSPLAANSDASNNFEFLLFDWKQEDQSFSNWGFAEEGFTLSRIQGTIEDYLPAFWSHAEQPELTVLASDYAEGTGWLDGAEYEFELVFEENRIRVYINRELIFDVAGTDPVGESN